MDKATGLVLRTTDWSETSRIATLWTRELGKVRALAKGGRRLKSAFESALDLLTVCSIVLLRKSSGGLDLLTEATVAERFPRLRGDLAALYGGYYVAELLADWTEDLDPHPALFDEALAALRELGQDGNTALRLMRFEMVFLHETGHAPVLDRCAACDGVLPASGLSFSPGAGGAVCPRCGRGLRDGRPVSAAALGLLRALAADDWRRPWAAGPRAEVRHLLGGAVGHIRGRQPRLLPYLGSG
jgi:DNA repair protein RecO (recombination protein O)